MHMLFPPPILKFLNYICYIILKTRQMEVFKKSSIIFLFEQYSKTFPPNLIFPIHFYPLQEML